MKVDLKLKDSQILKRVARHTDELYGGAGQAQTQRVLVAAAKITSYNNELQRRYTKRASMWSVVAIIIATLSLFMSSLAAYFAYTSEITQEDQLNKLREISENIGDLD